MFLVILGGLFLVAGLAVLGFIAAGAAPGALAVMAIIFVFVGLLNGSIGVVMLTRGRRRKRILATGIAGSGTIVEARQTSMEINDQPVIALKLEIQLPGRPSYLVNKRQVVPFIRLASIQPGTTLPIRVDPAKPNEIEIDWNGRPPSGRGARYGSDPVAAATAFLGAQFAAQAAQVAQPQVNPDTLDVPTLPPHMANMSNEELRENVREIGASGRAVVDTVSVVGPVGDKMGYRLGMWVQLDSGPSFRVDNGPASVETAYVSKVVPGVTVPLRIAHVRPGVTMTVLEWERL